MPVPALIPVPVSARPTGGSPFALAGAGITGDPDAAATLAALVRERTDADLPYTGDGRIRLVAGGGGPAESYRLVSGADGIEVAGADAAGLFYGVHTLAQLLAPRDEGWEVPAVEIADAPRFAWRGVMLDVARHFLPVADVCAYIDRAAALKFNRLHLHLTDDQGWRLALRSRPELTARAAAGAVGGDPGGFYTREDYAAILAHAAACHMVVVPEIDVPGHTHAVGLAYPELVADPVISDEVRAAAVAHGGGLPVRGTPYTGIAVGFSSLRTDDERTYAFLADVLGEVAALTPGPWVHLGGDEALGTRPADYATFITRAVDLVAATGKTPVLWHEAARVPDLPCDIVAQYWGGVADAAAHAADLRRAGTVILSPSDVAYLDMKPEPGFPLGLEWAGGPTSLRDAYGWEPSDVVPGLDAEDLLGVEAPLWGETVRTLADLDALAFPRLAAIAEIAWSPAPGAHPARTWESFAPRVDALVPLWRGAGVALPDGAAGARRRLGG